MGGATKGDSNAIQVSVFGMSDVGRVRKNNEDNFVVSNLTTGEVSLTPSLRRHNLGPRGTLFLVADGMGGEACGEVASQICTTTVPKRLFDNLKAAAKISETNFVLLLREAIEFANQVIFRKAESSAEHRGMGTTATAAALLGPHLFVAQVGDSRAYLIRNRKMFQLTRDQTFLNYLADIGADLPRDLENDSRKSILTQAVGTSETVEVKVTYTKVRQGDGILLCSDGLYNLVESVEIIGVVGGQSSLADKLKALIVKANQAGGTDNITAIMAEFTGPGLPPADPGAGVEIQEFDAQQFGRPD